jgi:hypothetical protein
MSSSPDTAIDSDSSRGDFGTCLSLFSFTGDCLVPFLLLSCLSVIPGLTVPLGWAELRTLGDDLEEFFETVRGHTYTIDELRPLHATVCTCWGRARAAFEGFLSETRKTLSAVDAVASPRQRSSNTKKVRFSFAAPEPTEPVPEPIEPVSEPVEPVSELLTAPVTEPFSEPVSEHVASPAPNKTEYTRILDGMAPLVIDLDSVQGDDSEDAEPSGSVPIERREEGMLPFRGRIRLFAEKALDGAAHQYQDLLLTKLDNGTRAWNVGGHCVAHPDTVKKGVELRSRIVAVKRDLDEEEDCFLLLSRTHKRRRAFYDVENDT